MTWEKQSKSVCLLVALFIGMGFVGSEGARALPPQVKHRAPQTPQVYVPSTNIPDDVQLVNADSNPTLRIPVAHSSLNWTLMKPRIRASYGWLEIDRTTVRYTVIRPSRSAREPDLAFEIQPDRNHSTSKWNTTRPRSVLVSCGTSSAIRRKTTGMRRIQRILR